MSNLRRNAVVLALASVGFACSSSSGTGTGGSGGGAGNGAAGAGTGGNNGNASKPAGFWGSYNNQLGGMGAGFGGWLAGKFGPDPNAAAQPWLQQGPQEEGKYLNPYIQQGQEAGNVLQGQYSKMLGDPGGFENWLGSKYQQSPGYQFQVNQATQAANRAAAAGGQVGGGGEQLGLAQAVSGFANKDYQQYLQNATGAYNQGLSGEQGFENQGYDASNKMAQMYQQYLQEQAGLAYANAQKQDNSLSGIGSLFGSAAGFIPGIGPIISGAMKGGI